MPLDAPSALLEVQSVKLSALLDAGLPAVAADPASDAPRQQTARRRCEPSSPTCRSMRV